MREKGCPSGLEPVALGWQLSSDLLSQICSYDIAFWQVYISFNEIFTWVFPKHLNISEEFLTLLDPFCLAREPWEISHVLWCVCVASTTPPPWHLSGGKQPYWTELQFDGYLLRKILEFAHQYGYLLNWPRNHRALDQFSQFTNLRTERSGVLEYSSTYWSSSSFNRWLITMLQTREWEILR